MRIHLNMYFNEKQPNDQDGTVTILQFKCISIFEQLNNEFYCVFINNQNIVA